MVKSCNLDRFLSYRREQNSLPFAILFQKILIYGRDCFVFASIVLFEVIPVPASGPQFFVVNMKGHPSDLKNLLQKG